MDLFGSGSLGTVTRVEEAKGLTSIYVGHKRVARMVASKAAVLGVVVGSEWTESLAERAAVFEETTRVLKRAVRLLRVRGRSEGELRERLLKAGFGGEAVVAAVAELMAKGLVNDRALAEAVAARGAEKGMSRGGAAQKIRARGIGEDIAARAVEQAGEGSQSGELGRAVEVARNRLAKLPESKIGAARHRTLLSALARLGYDEETATEAVIKVLGNPPGE